MSTSGCVKIVEGWRSGIRESESPDSRFGGTRRGRSAVTSFDPSLVSTTVVDVLSECRVCEHVDFPN